MPTKNHKKGNKRKSNFHAGGNNMHLSICGGNKLSGLPPITNVPASVHVAYNVGNPQHHALVNLFPKCCDLQKQGLKQKPNACPDCAKQFLMNPRCKNKKFSIVEKRVDPPPREEEPPRETYECNEENLWRECRIPDGNLGEGDIGLCAYSLTREASPSTSEYKIGCLRSCPSGYGCYDTAKWNADHPPPTGTTTQRNFPNSSCAAWTTGDNGWAAGNPVVYICAPGGQFTQIARAQADGSGIWPHADRMQCVDMDWFGGQPGYAPYLWQKDYNATNNCGIGECTKCDVFSRATECTCGTCTCLGYPQSGDDRYSKIDCGDEPCCRKGQGGQAGQSITGGTMPVQSACCVGGYC